MSRILVTGGAGMTGRAAIQRLLNTQPTLQVRATYHRNQPNWTADRLEWFQADLQNSDDCKRATLGCDTAILTAAITGGIASAINDPGRQMTGNIVMDSYLLEASYRAGIKRVIYLSSVTVYQPFSGSIREDQIDLNAEPHPSYQGVGWAKRAAEKFCRFWHDKFGIEFAILRCANIYGPGAQFDPALSNFIPALIRKASDRLDPFLVWGSPGVERDVIYVEDVAAAIILALHDNTPFDIYNLGAGKTVTVGEVVGHVLAAANYTPGSLIYQQNQPTNPARRMIDCTKFQQRFNWRPATDISEGISLTMRWWKNTR